MTVEFAKYADVTIAVIGLLQGGFLCLLLRAEGVRAFAANRWMMLFLGGVMINLFDDILELFCRRSRRSAGCLVLLSGQFQDRAGNLSLFPGNIGHSIASAGDTFPAGRFDF